jgi:tol-pal system protein YbgF
MIRGFSRFLFAAGVVVIVAVPSLAQQAPVPGTGANYEMRLEALEDQMRTLNGRIEQLEFAVRRLDQNSQRLQADTDARLTKLESAPPPTTVISPAVPPAASNIATPAAPVPSSAVGAASQAAAMDTTPAAASANGTLGAIKMQDGKITGGINNPQAPPLPDAPADYSLTPQEQYDRAFDLLREANYDEAGSAFQGFIAKNPQDKLIDNAKYWYGETLYVRGKFDQSAVAFADAYQANPQGNKAPDSLLKLAMSLENIDKVQDACTTLDSLKNKYPRASLSIRQRADTERSKLKCGSTPAAAGSH